MKSSKSLTSSCLPIGFGEHPATVGWQEENTHTSRLDTIPVHYRTCFGKMTDGKYDKARRQSSHKWVRLAMSIVAAFALAVVWKTRTGAKREKSQPIPVLKVPPAAPPLTDSLIKEVEELDSNVRKIKATGVIMEKDEGSLKATKKLQEATRRLLAARYGPNEPYRVRVVLEFQETIPDFKEKGADGSFLLEMAPSQLQPHSVFSFLEVARQWEGGAFHRNAAHVLQAMVHGGFKPLAFQEYSKEYPHTFGTVGYAGRPSGPAWYVSIIDNTKNHGPGSQQKHNPHEADSCFGKVIEGYDEVQRIKKMPGKEFLDDPKKHVVIKDMNIMVPGSGPDAVNGYVKWKDEL
jgi:hypothetical protein